VNLCCCGTCSGLGPGSSVSHPAALSSPRKEKGLGCRGGGGRGQGRGSCPAPVPFCQAHSDAEGCSAQPPAPSPCPSLLLVVVFPQDLLEKGLEADNFAMLGLGDIVIPGKGTRRGDVTRLAPPSGLRGAERVPRSAGGLLPGPGAAWARGCVGQGSPTGAGGCPSAMCHERALSAQAGHPARLRVPLSVPSPSPSPRRDLHRLAAAV